MLRNGFQCYFGHCLEMSGFRTNLELWTPYLLQKCVNEKQEHPNSFFGNIMFIHPNMCEIISFEFFGKDRCQQILTVDVDNLGNSGGKQN